MESAPFLSHREYIEEVKQGLRTKRILAMKSTSILVKRVDVNHVWNARNAAVRHPLHQFMASCFVVLQMKESGNSSKATSIQL